MLRMFLEGDERPTIKEMRKDPKLKHLLMDEKDTNPLINKMIRALKVKPKLRCLAPVEPKCTRHTIRSHSIQKRGPLSILADQSRHVIAFRAKPSFEERLRVNAERIGINEVSLFSGLCNQHDTEIFKPIDRNSIIPPTEEQLFLLSYRGFLREYYAKLYQAESSEMIEKSFENDPIISEEARQIMKMIAFDPYVGKVHMASLKESYDKLYLNRIFSFSDHPVGLKYLFRIFSKKMFFSVSSYFTPFFDFRGNRIDNDGPQKLLPFLTLDVIPTLDKTLVSLAYIKKFEKNLSSIISELSNADDSKFIKFVWELSLRNCENLVLAPKAWEKYNTKEKSQLEEFFTSFGLRWRQWPNISVPSE